MPSPKTLLPTSQSTCESTILPLPSLFIYFIMGFGNGKQTKFKIWAGPYCIDMQMRTCHWAPGSSDWKLTT